MTRKTTTAERVVESAAKLFLNDGFHEVTMDRIADTAGITKVTVYHHFNSKEALLAECLRWRLQRREEALDKALKSGLPPREALLSIFSWMEVNSKKTGFSGCAFLKATTEVAQKQAEVREIAMSAKRQLRERCSALAEAAGCANASTVGAVCALLIDGAQALSLIEQSAQAFRTAREQAAVLMDMECRRP